MSYLQLTSDGVLLRIKLVPRASVNRIDGPHGDALKIRLNAPPVDGKANAALIELIARLLRAPKSAVSIRSGETARIKQIFIAGAPAAYLDALQSLAPTDG